MRISRSALRLAAHACALAAALILAPGARAQDLPCLLPGSEPIESQPICEIEPRVDVNPPSAALGQPTVRVTIAAFDHYSGNRFSSFVIMLDGDTVTSQWGVVQADSGGTGTGRGRKFTASGTITLSEADPERTLYVKLCDTVFCTPVTRTWTLLRPGVQVGEDGTIHVEPPNAPHTKPFTVRNTGVSAATFALTAECRDALGQPLTPCSVSQASISLAAGATGSVSASYPGTQQGGTVTVVVRARQTDAPGVEDAGWTDVEIRAMGGVTEAAPQVALVPLTAGTAVERSQCVTVATALRGAYECGDLRVAHALPAHRTRGRTWAPVLLYNSQHAHPRPIVYADVTVPATAPVPTTVEMVVTMASGAVHRAVFDGNPFLPGQTRRIGVQWDALGQGTSLYGYNVQVISHYPGGPRAIAPIPGEIAIVDRGWSGFGAGWWLAGVERIICVDCHTGGSRTLWVGGDGSTRVYERTSPGAWTAWGSWVAQNPDGPPDTLVLGAEGYVRKIRGGGRVYFDGGGLHTRTVNRLGQTTRIVHGIYGPTGVYVPGTGAGGPGTGDPAWIMNWEGTEVRSISATAAGAPTRTVALTMGTHMRVTAITDPDSGSVGFYYADNATARRMMGQRDRRGTWTWYGYDNAGKLVISTMSPGSAPDPATNVTAYYGPAESHGVAFAGATGAASVAAANAATQIDGPRTDVLDITHLWLTPRGTVRRVRDALGGETYVQFGDARFPALATRVASQTGVVSTATYDARGRVTSSTVTGAYGGTESTTTTTAWDAQCERPTMTRAPGADTVFAAYDPATCNVLWQRLGRDTNRTVTFTYHPAGHAHAGMVDSIIGPRDAQGRRAVERVFYDTRGNLRMTASPLGFRSLYVRDALGRDSVVYMPLADSTASDTVRLKQHGMRQTILYDRMDRVRETTSYGPAIDQYRAAPPGSPSVGPGTTPAEELQVGTEYDAEGSPLTVVRTQYPNPAGLQPQITRYQYDRAGRKTDEWNNETLWTHYAYDPAGNVTTVITPRLAQVTNRYDAAGRLVRRTVPGMRYPATAGSCGTVPANPGEPTCNNAKFPYFPNDGTGYTIPEEWTTYRYDGAGNLRHAENRDAVVRRTYHPNGQVRTDSSYVREFGDNGVLRASGIEYGYHEGRLTRLLHPAHLAGSARVDTFSYHPQTGELAMARDRNGNAFSFTYDNTGALVRTTLPGAITDTARYDLEGRLEWRREVSPHYTVPLQEETYVHDARNKLVAATAKPSVGRSTEATFWQWYSGLGNLVMTHWANATDAQWQREAFTVDPLGNVVHRRSVLSESESPSVDNPDFRYTFDAAVGRVRQVELVDVSTGPWLDQTSITYDASGNQETSYQRVYSDYQWRRVSDSRSYYGLDDRLRAVQKYETQFATAPKDMGLFEEYRYDPLGRRVGVRTRRPSALCNQSPQCFNSTTYFVWAGDQLLWETKIAESPAPQQAGGTVSYFQAGGIDRPLVIWKSGVGSVVTHQNWRGQFARGTWGAGHSLIGQSSDCTATYTGQNCVPVPWPGWNTGAWFQEAAKPQTVGSERYWLGSLSVEMRDASGLMYKRNRYYNPQTGQFTQPDPIGLAGGLNIYGFAAGDPVTYSDPYGLCPIPLSNCFQNVANWGARRGGIVGGIAQYGGAAGVAVVQTVAEVGEFVSPVERIDMGDGTTMLAASPPAVGGPLRGAALLDDIGAQYRNIRSALSSHNHFQAARLELTGRLSTGFDHAGELRDFANGLNNSIARLRNILSRPGLDDALRERATELLSRTSRLRDTINEALR